MDKKGDVGVSDEVCHLAGGRVGGHDDDGGRGVGRRGEVGVVHERDMGHVIGASRKMKLWR